MLALECSIWMFRRLSRIPLAWMAMGLAGAAWPLVVAFSPLTLTMTAGDATELASEAGWWGSLLFILFALQSLDGVSWLMNRGTGLRPIAARTAALFTAGAAGSLAGLLGAALFGGSLNLEWTEIALSAVLSLAQLSLLSCWLLQITLPAIWRSLSLVVLAWALPAIGSSGNGALARVATLFETQGLASGMQDSTLHGWIVELMPIGVLALAVFLTAPSSAKIPRSVS